MFPHQKNKIGWFCNVLQHVELPYCLFLSDFPKKNREGELTVRGHRHEQVSFLEVEEKSGTSFFLLEVWGIRDPDTSVFMFNASPVFPFTSFKFTSSYLIDISWRLL